VCFSSFPSNSRARNVLGRPPDVEASSVVPSLHTRFARGGRGVRPYTSWDGSIDDSLA
jgi:hypothetical protein